MGDLVYNTFGTLSSAPDNTIVTTIYNYLTSILLVFKGKNDENENAITNRLCKTLNSRKPVEYSFFFQHQNIEDEKVNTSTDLAAFGTYSYAQEINIKDTDSPALIKFEAKRLNSTLPAKREKEYVCGEYKNGKCIKNSGGIERFKNGRHGKDVENAAIIGYIQTESTIHWFNKVNLWIQEQIKSPSDTTLTWNKRDFLCPDNHIQKISCYSSISQRISGEEIQLRHFWIDISK